MKTFLDYQEFLHEQHAKSVQNNVLKEAISPAENLVEHLKEGETLLRKFSKISEDLVTRIDNVAPTSENIKKIKNEVSLNEILALDRELTDIKGYDTPSNGHFNIGKFVAQGYNETSLLNYRNRLAEVRRLSSSVNKHNSTYAIVIDSFNEFINKRRVFPRAQIKKQDLAKANQYISERNITEEERMKSNITEVNNLIGKINVDTKIRTKRNIKRLSISLLSAVAVVLIFLNLGAVVGATLAVLKVIGIIIIVAIVLSAISNG